MARIGTVGMLAAVITAPASVRPTVRIRRLAGAWFVAFDDGTTVRANSESEAVLSGLRWVLAHRPSCLLLETDFGPSDTDLPRPPL